MNTTACVSSIRDPWVDQQLTTRPVINNPNVDKFYVGERTWISDFPPHGGGLPWYPVPNMLPWYLNFFEPLQWIDMTSTVCKSPWRTELKGDLLLLSVDVPGMLAEDLTVTVNEYWVIEVRGSRHDTQQAVAFIHSVDKSYDRDTVEASLSSGVLRITLKRTVDRQVRTVPVTAR